MFGQIDFTCIDWNLQHEDEKWFATFLDRKSKDNLNVFKDQGAPPKKLYFPMYSAMEQYARWCYYQRCRTNIYNNNYQPQEWERIAAENVKNDGSWLYFTVQLFMKRDIVHI